MTSLEQLETALRNADAAGDVEAARALASEYQRIQLGEPKQSIVPSAGADLNKLGESFEQGTRDIQSSWGAIKTLGQLKRYEHAAKQGDPIAQREFKDLQQNIKDLTEKNKEIAAGYQNPALGRLSQAKTFGEGLGILAEDPIEIFTHGIARNLPQMTATLITAAVTRNPALTAMVAGGSEFAMEFGNSIMSYAADNGVNVTDPASVDKFYNDPKVLQAAIEYSTKRATAIGAGEAVVGRAISKALGAAKPGVGRVRHVITHGSTASVAGAAGEKAAQVVTGEDKPGEVIAEAVVGGGMTTAAAVVGGKQTSKKEDDPEAIVNRVLTGAGQSLESLQQPIVPQNPVEAGIEDVQRPIVPVEDQMPVETPVGPQEAISEVEATTPLPTPPQRAVERSEAPEAEFFGKSLREVASRRETAPEADLFGQSLSQALGVPAQYTASPANIEQQASPAPPNVPIDEVITEVNKIHRRLASIPGGQDQLQAVVENADDDHMKMLHDARALEAELLPEKTPEQIKREERNARRRAAYARKKAERAAQLAKADALDKKAEEGNMPDPEANSPVHPSNYDDLVDQVMGNIEKTTAEKRAVAKRVLIEGPRKGDSINNQISPMLRMLISTFTDKTPFAYKIIANRLLTVMDTIYDMGIHLKVEYVTQDEFRNLYGSPEGTPNAVAFGRKPNFRRPNGEYVVAFRIDDEGAEKGLKDGANNTTILHEIVHVATMGVIRGVQNGIIRDKKLIAAVKTLDKIRKQILKEGPSDISEENLKVLTENADEMVAYGMTSPKLQSWMKVTPDATYPKRSLWKSFTNGLMQALGLGAGPVTQQEKVIQAFDEITTAVITKPDEAIAWLKENVQNYDIKAQFNEIMTPANLTVMRESVESVWHQISPNQYRSPYGAFFDLTKNVSDDRFVFHGMFEDELFAGGVPQEPNGNKDAPYVLVMHPDHPGYNVVVNLPNDTLWMAVKTRFSGYTVMTPAQGSRLIRSGISPTAVQKKITKEDNSKKQKALGGMFPGKPELFEPFLDINNPDEAMALMKANGKDLPALVSGARFMLGGPNAVAILSNNPIIRFVRARVHDVVKAQSQMARRHVQGMGDLWFKMTDNEKIITMRLATEQDTMQRDFTISELHGAGVPTSSITMLQLMRNSLNESIETWNQQRARLGLDSVPVRGGYFPSIFVGDYRAVARDATGEVVGLVTAATNKGLEAKQKQIQAKFPDVTFDATKRIDIGKQNNYGQSYWDQLDVIQRFIRSDVAQISAQEFADFLSQISVDDARHILGFSRHEKYKTGVWGSQGRDPTVDAKENAVNAFQALIVYLEDGAQHHALMETLSDMAEITTNPEMRAQFPRTVQYMDDLYQHISRRKSPGGGESTQGQLLHGLGQGIDTIIDATLKTMGVGPNSYRKSQALLRSVFSASVMGFMNLPFTMLQILQVVQCGPQAASYLRAATGLGITSARGRLASAQAIVGTTRMFMDFVSTKMTGEPIKGLDWFGGDADTKIALNYALENNLITLNDLELAHTAMLSPAMRKVDKTVNLNQRAAEAATRPLVFLWLFNIVKHTNMSLDQKLTVARNAANFVMAEYHSTARPMVYQSVGTTGPVFGQLKTYAHSYTGQQAFWIKEAFKGNNVTALAVLLMTYTLFVGLDGTPGWDELDYIARLISGAFNEEPTGYKDLVSPYIPDALKYGILSSVTGIDFQRRLRMPPLIQDGLSNLPALNWATDIGAKWYDYLDDWYKTGESDPVKRRAASFQALPSSIKGPAEIFLYRDDLGREMTKDGLGFWDHRNEGDWDLRWFGMQSLEDTLRKEQLRNAEAKNRELSIQRREIAKDFVTRAVTEKGMDIEKYHELRGKYLQLGGDLKELDSQVSRAKERQARGEALDFLQTKPTSRTWFFYEEGRR